MMHCSCDERFRSCLKMSRTQAADIVGNLFFNIFDIPCFVFSKEVVSQLLSNVEISANFFRFVRGVIGGEDVFLRERK